MLEIPDLLLMAVTTLVVTTAMTAGAVVVLRSARRASVAVRFAVVPAVSLASIVVSTVAVAYEMYLSGHDLVVLCWVVGISALMSTTAAWITGRTVRSSVSALITDTRRVGDGAVIDASCTGWTELDAVSRELADTSQRLADARARIGELDAARRQFFAWISHDLRTPLAGMSAMAEALEEGSAADPRSYIRTIRSKVDTINRMVDDLFELSTLQTGTLELEPEPVVLLDLVSDAVADVQAVAAARGILIAQDGIDGHILWVDPRELTRAIGNLLANSIRHAPDDSVILIRADATRTSELILSVIDQGAGVSSENLGRIFDVGWRADAARSREPGSTTSGAGLGLAIVRGIAEAHGGTVRARRTDAGFQLDLHLPRHGPQQNPASTGRTCDGAADARHEPGS